MNKSQARKPTNLTLDAALVVEARSFDINISSAAEDGLRRAVASAKAKASAKAAAKPKPEAKPKPQAKRKPEAKPKAAAAPKVAAAP